MQNVFSRLRLAEKRLTVLAFAILILSASGARLLTFDRYLPYIDYNDEPNTYVLARNWRGLENDQTINDLMQGYPPLYVWVNIGVQQVVEAVVHKPWIGPADYSFALRFFSALVGVATSLLVVTIGWQLAGPVAGWFAGLVWAIAPLVVENNNYAIADPFVYLGSAAALAMAIHALHRQKPLWVLGSFVAGLVAIFSKYTAVYSLMPGALVGLILLIRKPRQMLGWAITWIALVGGAAFYLVFIYGALKLDIHEAQLFRSQGLQLAFSPAHNLNNLLVSVWPLGWPLFFVTLTLGLIAHLVSRRRRWRTVNLWQTVLILIPYAVVTLIISASATNASTGKMRHVLPLTISLVALWGVMIVQIGLTLADWSRRYTPGWRRHMPQAALIIIGLIAATPMLTGLIQKVSEFSLPNTHVLLWRWTDANIPPDGRILMHPSGDLERTWNRNWGGYDGVTTFEWWFAEDPTGISPRAYYDQAITYFAVSDNDLAGKYNLPGMDAFLKQLTLLKTIPGAPEHSGPTVYFYRMIPPRIVVNVNFGGEIVLAGYDVNGVAFQPGDTIRFRPYWRALQRPTSNYSIFIHLCPDGSDQMMAQYDGPPTTPQRPTLTWDDLNELYMGGNDALVIPKDIQPGKYILKIGLYDFNTGRRLVLPDNADSFTIPVTIGIAGDLSSEKPGKPDREVCA